MAPSTKIDAIKVRMYRHGFGDCFLLSFMQAQTTVRTMLIDCGIKKATSREEAPMDEVIADIRAAATAPGTDKPKLDVLVITHEHWDHISSFFPTKKRNYFKDFEFGQIWLAWTEDPDDPEAVAINARLREGSVALGIAADRLAKVEHEEADRMKPFYDGEAASAGRKAFGLQLDDVLGFYGTSLKEVSESGIQYDPDGKISTDTQKALENILTIGKANSDTVVKYFLPGTSVEEDLLPAGIKVHILGPPRNKLINKSTPSHGSHQETYFGMDGGGLAGFVDGLLAMGARDANPDIMDHGCPFKQGVGTPMQQAEQDPFLYLHYFQSHDAYRRIDNSWLNATGQFALQLDDAINNTSLVLAIEMEGSGKVLLFPGDAQVGSWLSWHDYAWKTADPDKKQTAQDLLAKTVLYKVSHHGSHNATLKEKGLELMTDPKLVAMIPEREDSYSGILYKPLFAQLEKNCKGRVIVSADVGYPPEDLLTQKPNGLSKAEWAQFKENLVVERLYVEYLVRG